MARLIIWRMASVNTPVFFSRMLHGRGVCRLASPRAVAAATTGGGDLVSQLVLESREDVDATRCMVHMVLGAAIDGAALQRWYALLHSRLPFSASGPIFSRTLVQRLLCHHLLFASVTSAAFIAASVSCAPDLAPWQQLRQGWWPAICWHWLIVAPTQAVNACVVPKSLQVLVANSCAMVWAAALSRICHRTECSEREVLS